MNDHPEHGVSGEPMRFRSTIGGADNSPPPHPYAPVAEDIEWLRDEWARPDQSPSSAALRRGSGTLRLLLRDGAINKAWRYCGLPGGPTIIAPDFEALANCHGHELRHSASAIAGGGTLRHACWAMIGSWRIDHPQTGVPADSEEGFAVATTCIVRDTREPPPDGPLNAMMTRQWKLKDYLDAPGAIRRGEAISRQEIIEFFAHYAGGVHFDRVADNSRNRALYEFVGELESKLKVDTADGLYFELLSIGQAVGTSPAMLELAAAIRAGATA